MAVVLACSSPSLSRPPQPLCLEGICAGARPFFTPRESPLVVGRSPVDPVPGFAVPFPMKPLRYPNFARKCFLKSRTNLGDCGPPHASFVCNSSAVQFLAVIYEKLQSGVWRRPGDMLCLRVDLKIDAFDNGVDKVEIQGYVRHSRLGFLSRPLAILACVLLLSLSPHRVTSLFP